MFVVLGKWKKETEDGQGLAPKVSCEYPPCDVILFLAALLPFWQSIGHHPRCIRVANCKDSPTLRYVSRLRAR